MLDNPEFEKWQFEKILNTNSPKWNIFLKLPKN
jgi:hypothetical protein